MVWPIYINLYRRRIRARNIYEMSSVHSFSSVLWLCYMDDPDLLWIIYAISTFPFSVGAYGLFIIVQYGTFTAYAAFIR